MAVNQSAFFRGERTLLFQDSVRNTCFADVMKQGRDFDLIHMFWGNFQFSSDSDRLLRQSRAMYPGTDVLESEWLVERTGQRIAKRKVLLFQLLTALH